MKKQTIALNSVTALLRNRWLHAAASLAPGLAMANPVLNDIAVGAAALAQSGNTLQINQSTASAVLNWNSFSIGQDEFVIFNQPSSSAVTLNRVLGGSMSELLGSMQANGRVFLINPAGILVGQGAQIDVNSFIASTQNITDADFLDGNANGRYVFSGASAQSIVNNGNVTAADGGFVVLLGDTVTNTGVIQATKGTVVLASGSAMTLDITGNGLVSYTVDQAALSDAAGVENLGDVLADGGKVVMTADVARSTAKAAVNNSGFVSARSIIEGKNGEIILSASGGDVVNSGALDVSGTAASPNAGKVRITSDRNIHLTDTSRIVANGDGLLGRGGNVRVIADDTLLFTRGATIQGRGGLGGGFVELSGHKALRVRGALDLGQGGRVLIDPDFLTIANGSGPGGSSDGDATIFEETVEGLLQYGTDVALVARKQITLSDLQDNVLDGGNEGASLFLGIGSIGTGTDYGVYEGSGFPFMRSAGDAAHGIVFEDGNDTIRVDGELRFIGGYADGDLILGNLEAGGDISIENAQNISVNGLSAAGGLAQVFSQYGSITLGAAQVTGSEFAFFNVNAYGDVSLSDVTVSGYGGSSDEAGAAVYVSGRDIALHGDISVRADEAFSSSTEMGGESGYTSNRSEYSTLSFAQATFSASDDLRVHSGTSVRVEGAGGAEIKISAGNANASDDFYVNGVFIEGDVTAVATLGHSYSAQADFYDGFQYAGSSRSEYSGFAEIEISTGWSPNYGDVVVAYGATISASGYGGDDSDHAARIELETQQGDIRVDGALVLNGYSATTVSQGYSSSNGNTSSDRNEQRRGSTELELYTFGGDIVIGEYSTTTIRAVGEAEVFIGTGVDPHTPEPVYGDIEIHGDFDVLVAAGYSDTVGITSNSDGSFTEFERTHTETGSFHMTVDAEDDVYVGSTASIKVRTSGDAILEVFAANGNENDEYIVTGQIEMPVGDGEFILVDEQFSIDGVFFNGDVDVVASAGYAFGNGYSDSGTTRAAYDSFTQRLSNAEMHFGGSSSDEIGGDVYIGYDADIRLADYGGSSQRRGPGPGCPPFCEGANAAVSIDTTGSVILDGDITLIGNAGQDDHDSYSQMGTTSSRRAFGGAELRIQAGGSDGDDVSIGEYSVISLNGNGSVQLDIHGAYNVDIDGTLSLDSGRGSYSAHSSGGFLGAGSFYNTFAGGTTDFYVQGSSSVDIARDIVIRAQGAVEVDIVGGDISLSGINVSTAGTSRAQVEFTIPSDPGGLTLSLDYSNYAPVDVSITTEAGGISIGSGGVQLTSSGDLNLEIRSTGQGNVEIDGPVVLVANAATGDFNYMGSSYSTTPGTPFYAGSDGSPGYQEIPETLATFSSSSDRITVRSVGGSVNADFYSGGDVVIDSGLTARGGDVDVDIRSTSSGDVYIGGPVQLTSTGLTLTATFAHTDSSGQYAGYEIGSTPTTLDGYNFYNGSSTENGGAAVLNLFGANIEVRGAISVTGVDYASAVLDASSGDVFVGTPGENDGDDVAHNISVVASAGRTRVNFTGGSSDGYGIEPFSEAVDIRGGSAQLVIAAASDGSSSGGFVTAGDITVRSQLHSQFILDADSSAQFGDVVVRSEGGAGLNRMVSFPIPISLPELPAHGTADVVLGGSFVSLDSLLVRADGDVTFDAPESTVIVDGDAGLFAGRDLSVGSGEAGSMEAESITLQAGLAGAREEEGDHAIGDVEINSLDLTARNVLSITAADSIFAGSSSGAITLEGDGVGLSAGYSIDASYATFYVGDGAAPFGADTLLNLALTVFAPEALPDSANPNFAVSAEYVALQPGTFHMNGYGAGGSSDGIGVGDHLLIRADHLTFTGSSTDKFHVPLDVTVNFRSFTPNGSIGLEQSNTDEEFGNTIQDLNLTVVDHLSRFPGNSMEGLPETDAYSTSFVLGSGLNTGDIIVGETVQPVSTLKMLEEVPPPEEEPPQTPVALELGDDNLICVTNGTTQGCTIPPVQTGGLVTSIAPIVLLSSTPTNSEINIKPDEIDQKDPRKKHVVVKESAEDANDREVQQKTSDGTTLECT